MDNRFIRTEMLLGKEAMDKLQKSKVAVFGIGGVGSFAAEAIARSGVGNIILIDNDVISLSNINRQIHALSSTIGMFKTEAMKSRIKDINPYAEVEIYNEFFVSGSGNIIQKDWDYIVDAIDTVSGKIELVLKANEYNIPIISSMGTGNKLKPEMLEITDIYSTEMCPLAKVMRHELKKRGIKKLKVVYSKEPPLKSHISESELISSGENTNKRLTPASISFVPPVAGLLIASEVIKNITEV